MKILCVHGYFYFYEEESGEVATFNSYYNQDLTLNADHYTFAALKELSNYSIEGNVYGDSLATKTYTGEIYEILRQNNLVYNFLLKVTVNKNTIATLVKPIKSYKFYIYNGLILPGSFQSDNKLILGYTCKVNLKELIYRYGEFSYD